MTTPQVLPRSRVSAEQLDILLTFMEEHPEFASCKQSIYSRFTSSKLWRLLSERLNASAAQTGGAVKTPDKWCRYWADIKYKARKKSDAGGALGELSSVEERLNNIYNSSKGVKANYSGVDRQGARHNSHSDEDRKPSFCALDEDMCSESSTTGDRDAPRLTTEELLAEAAMRTALAAEKQAEAVTQAVELLRDVVSILRERLPIPAPHMQHPPPPTHPVQHAPDQLVAMQHHHHRL